MYRIQAQHRLPQHLTHSPYSKEYVIVELCNGIAKEMRESNLISISENKIEDIHTLDITAYVSSEEELRKIVGYAKYLHNNVPLHLKAFTRDLLQLLSTK